MEKTFTLGLLFTVLLSGYSRKLWGWDYTDGGQEDDSRSNYTLSMWPHLLVLGNSWFLNSVALENYSVFQKSFWEWHLCLKICLKWKLEIPSTGQLGDNIINHLASDLPMSLVKSIFNLTTPGNAKPPASKDGSSKRAELQNTLNSLLLVDKRIISTQALVLCWRERK